MILLTIHETDFDINDEKSQINFASKLQNIPDFFGARFDYQTTKLPAGLFYRTKLVRIDLPDTLEKISNSAFIFSEFLKEVNLPNSVTEIGNYAFYDCSELIKINLPNSITKIGSYAFRGCSKLTEINLPNTTTEIFSNAFSDCISLKKILLPKSLEFLGDFIFHDCPCLEEIIIPFSKNKFLSTVKGAEKFYSECKDLISFEDPLSLDNLLSENNSLEKIIKDFDLNI